MTVIDNDYHPDDQGLEASQEDHWGTVHDTETKEALDSGRNQDLKNRAYQPATAREYKRRGQDRTGQ